MTTAALKGTPAGRPYDGETYYDRPALKPAHYRWLIAFYFWVGGIAGGAAVLSAVADLLGSPGDRVVVQMGRYLALAGCVIGPLLLILDLYTPQRFLNMLRIFRRTSAMSVGAWALAVFGLFSGLAAVAQLAEDLGAGTWAVIAGRVVGIPAAAVGAFIGYYTATLLAATNVPLWAAVPRSLSVLFAASAMSLGAAALTLAAKAVGSPEAVTRRLELYDLIVAVFELAALVVVDWQWRRQGVAGPIWSWPNLAILLVGVVALGILFPMAVHASGLLAGHTPTALSVTAAVARLTGGFLLRTVILFAGKPSAEDPRDYFRMTSPAPGPSSG